MGGHDLIKSDKSYLTEHKALPTALGNKTLHLPRETLQVLTEALIPSDGSPALPTQQSGSDVAMILKISAPHRLDRAVKELKLNKSPGPDGIWNEMITKAWHKIKDPLRVIFRTIH